MNTANLYADREGRTFSKPHETWLEFVLIKFNCLLFTFFTVSYLNIYPLFLCFDKFWQLETTHARDNTRVREARILRQNDLTWFDFFAGETSKALALSLAFTAENINNLPLALRTCEKNWAQPVGKSTSARIFHGWTRSNSFEQFIPPPKSNALLALAPGRGTWPMFGYRGAAEGLKSWPCLGQEYAKNPTLSRATASISRPCLGLVTKCTLSGFTWI